MNSANITLTTIFLLVLVNVILPWVKHWGDKYIFDTEDFSNNLEKSIEINDKLRYLRHEYVAIRVFVMHYHNGGKFYNNKKRQKLSMLDEAYSEHEKGILNTFQDLPINYMAEITEKTQREGVFIISDLKSINNSTERNMLKENGVSSIKCIAVYKKLLTMKLVWGFLPLFETKSQMVASIHFWLPKHHDEIANFFTTKQNIKIDRAIATLKKDLI